VIDGTEEDAGQRVHRRTYRWPDGFAGFRARLRARTDRREASGSVRVRAARDILVAMDPDDERWPQDEMSSIVRHRWPRARAEPDALEGRRGPDGEPAVVTGQIGRERFSIRVIDHVDLPGDRLLTTMFSITHWEVRSDRLLRVHVVRDGFADVEGILLPASREIVTSADGGVRTRLLELSEHRLLPARRG
jgi:hypothetical protein